MTEQKKCMKADWNRVIYDLQYIVLNKFVNQIPCWNLRKRIYKKFGVIMGKGSRIGIGTIVLGPDKIKIGDRSIINENCLLDGRGGLVIGHDTSISSYSKILTASHRNNSPNFDYYTQKTKIGNNVWIGTAAVILNGSVLEDYVIIGAGAVMKGNAKEKFVMVGNPAKYLKKRDLTQAYHLKYNAYFR